MEQAMPELGHDYGRDSDSEAAAQNCQAERNATCGDVVNALELRIGRENAQIQAKKLRPQALDPSTFMVTLRYERE
jgi:hypothetical protein